MRLRILTVPLHTIDGVSAADLHIGGIYDVDAKVAERAVTEGWGEFLADPGPTTVRTEHASRECRVLVVEDDPELRHFAESVLTAHGYRVRAACDGRDAMQQAHDECPDLIVLDLHMPIMDGWQFRSAQRHFAEQPLAAVRVLLMTASDDADSQASVLSAVGVLKKPF